MAHNTIGSKIRTLDELTDIIPVLKKGGKTVVQCHGVFDLLHLGHIRHFEAAKREGDILVVTLTKDIYVAKGPGRPVFNEQLRAESIAALESVDYVAVNQWPTAIETINKLKPDIYAKGSDYVDEKEDLTGKIQHEIDAVRDVGGRVHFTNEITFSSTKLINHNFDVLPEEARRFLREFRGKYSSREIINRLKALKKMRVLVIGDTIIDEYHYCTPLGKSPKEIIIPAQFLSAETFAGGVLAIANHLAGFSNHVEVLTGLGTQNSYEEFILAHLKPSVKAKFFYRPDAPTIVKRRFVETTLLRKLFEVYLMDGNTQPETLNQEIRQHLESNLGDYDLVVVGDYGHGFLQPAIIDTLCEKARFLAVNAQTNSANIGFNLITKYPRADYVCIDEPEIRLATHDNIGPVEDLLSGIARELHCHQAVVTRGYRGSLVHTNDGDYVTVPAFSREVLDSVGAGDAYLAITSLCVAAGFPGDLVGFIGNTAGALAIRIIGNKTSIEPVALSKYITTLLK